MYDPGLVIVSSAAVGLLVVLIVVGVPLWMDHHPFRKCSYCGTLQLRKTMVNGKFCNEECKASQEHEMRSWQ
jgi:hypothetical protein